MRFDIPQTFEIINSNLTIINTSAHTLRTKPLTAKDQLQLQLDIAHASQNIQICTAELMEALTPTIKKQLAQRRIKCQEKLAKSA